MTVEPEARVLPSLPQFLRQVFGGEAAPCRDADESSRTPRGTCSPSAPGALPEVPAGMVAALCGEAAALAAGAVSWG